MQYSYSDFEKLNNRLPDNLKWVKCSDSASAEHQHHTVGGTNNEKWISADGHFEAVYSSAHVLQTQYNNPDDMGTYNYYSYLTHPVKHLNHDLLPYKIYGNMP